VPGGERSVIGNPNLLSASITNHDLRWEWSLSPSEIVSVSAFYKDMKDAIEQVSLSQTSRAADSFRNADATLYGLEFEGRKNLSFLYAWVSNVHWLSPIAPELENVSLQTNVSYIESEADLGTPGGLDCSSYPPPQECTEVQTSKSRPFVGQAPYTVNASVEYGNSDWGTTRLLYNTVGRRIVAAGIDGLPDIYEEPRNQLDLVWFREIEPFGLPLNFKVSLENILNEPVEQTQDLTVRRYRTGVKFGFGVSYSY
jgi:outer membrane receptor protein involved in Fe transport